MSTIKKILRLPFDAINDRWNFIKDALFNKIIMGLAGEIEFGTVGSPEGVLKFDDPTHFATLMEVDGSAPFMVIDKSTGEYILFDPVSLSPATSPVGIQPSAAAGLQIRGILVLETNLGMKNTATDILELLDAAKTVQVVVDINSSTPRIKANSNTFELVDNTITPTNKLTFDLSGTGIVDIDTPQIMRLNPNGANIACFGLVSSGNPEFFISGRGVNTITWFTMRSGTDGVNWNHYFKARAGKGGDFVFEVDTGKCVSVPNGYFRHQITTSDPDGVITACQGATLIYNKQPPGTWHFMVQVDNDGDGTGDHWVSTAPLT